MENEEEIKEKEEGFSELLWNDNKCKNSGC